MATSQGFWSYVHDDDDADGKRITRLADDIVKQYQMLTGEKVSLLFLDQNDIRWGDKWRQEIEASLASVAFFVPVMTPRYFMSPECRRELQFFMRKATDLGVKELVLPLHYVNVDQLGNQLTTDDLVKLLQTFHWEDWRELRFADVTSSEYRRAVSRLAERLVEANHQAEASSSPPEGVEALAEDDEAPGQIDTLAETEEGLTQLPETLSSLAREVTQIGELMKESTENAERLQDQRKGFSARLTVARLLASKLVAPVENILKLGNLYATQIHSVDTGFRIIIERANIDSQQGKGDLATYCSFFESIRKMSKSSEKAIFSMKGMLEAVQPLEAMSRDLRPVIRRLKQGLTLLVESSEVTQEWVRLIETTKIDCQEPSLASQTSE